MELKEALEAVVNESNNPYAKTYAQAALELGDATEGDVTTIGNTISVDIKPTDKMMVGEEMRVQLLYVLSNLSYWRGERSKEIKDILKGYSKER